MAKKFLSFLGGGNYNSCNYKYAQLPKNVKREYETRFIQVALTEIFCGDWDEDDKVIIFLTEVAKKRNWENREEIKIETSEKPQGFIDRLLNRKPDKIEKKIKIAKKGLEYELKCHNLYYEEADSNIVKDKKFKIESVDIKDGNSMDEIWENFDTVISQIEDGDEIIFDITHAFRYIPMLALVVLNYAKVLKNNIKISGIYYGNFEYNNNKYHNPEFENGQKPIMNLLQLDEILEWSQAVNSFVKYGNSDHIKNFAYEILNNENNNEYYKDDESLIKELVDSLSDFTNTVQTCRGKTIKNSDSTNSISKAYQRLNTSLKEFKNAETSMKPLDYLIGSIDDRLEPFKPRQNRKEIINVGIGIVDWSIKNNLIQQAYTSLLETIVTYMCLLENVDKDELNDYSKRDSIRREYQKKYNNNIDRPAYMVQGNIKVEIAMILGELSKIRNDINHYGYTEKGYRASTVPSRSYLELRTIIKEHYSNFVELVEREEQRKFNK